MVFISKIYQSEFFRSAFVVTSLSFLVNVGNYIFQLINARFLTKADFGELQSLLALLILISIPSAGIGSVITKYIAEIEPSFIRSLYRGFDKYILKFCAYILVIYLMFIPVIKNILGFQSYMALVLVGFLMVASIYSLLPKSALLGMKEFNLSAIINFIEVVFKNVFAFIVLYLGFNYNYVLGGVVITLLFGIAIAKHKKLKIFDNIINHQDHYINYRDTIKLLLGFTIGYLGLNLFYNLDIILVKKFLLPEEVGEYGVLSLLGKIIFFTVASFSAVIIPYIANAKAKSEDVKKYALNIFSVVTLIGLCSGLVYYFESDFMVGLLFGEKYLNITNLVFPMAIGYIVYSFIYAYTQYLFALGETWVAYNLLTGVIVMAILYIFRHGDLYSVVMNFLWSVSITLISICLVQSIISYVKR